MRKYRLTIWYILRRLAARFSLKAVAFLVLMSAIAGVLCAQEPQLLKAPPNPAFVKWQEKRREAQRARQAIQPPVFSEPADNRFGYIPEPFLPPGLTARPPRLRQW